MRIETYVLLMLSSFELPLHWWLLKGHGTPQVAISFQSINRGTPQKFRLLWTDFSRRKLQSFGPKDDWTEMRMAFYHSYLPLLVGDSCCFFRQSTYPAHGESCCLGPKFRSTSRVCYPWDGEWLVHRWLPMVHSAYKWLMIHISLNHVWSDSLFICQAILANWKKLYLLLTPAGWKIAGVDGVTMMVCLWSNYYLVVEQIMRRLFCQTVVHYLLAVYMNL